jgi:hypothetical protein
MLIVDFAVSDDDIDRRRRISGCGWRCRDAERLIHQGPQLGTGLRADRLKELVSKSRITLEDGVRH